MCYSVLQYIAVCCRFLQCVALYCSKLQCVAVSCSELHCVAVCCMYDNEALHTHTHQLQHPEASRTATHCNTLPLTATHCNTRLQHCYMYIHTDKPITAARRFAGRPYLCELGIFFCVAVCCSMLQYVAACCSMLQHVAACCSMLHHTLRISRVTKAAQSHLPKYVAAFCSMLQYVAVCCSMLQHNSVCCSIP